GRAAPPPAATGLIRDPESARRPARVAGRLLPCPDRDRRGVQLRRLLALPRPARLHDRGLARLPPQLRVPTAVLEVRTDVADRVGDRRRARLSARVLPGAFRDEAQVRPPPAVDRSVPDELPPAGARLEGDPRQPGRRQQLPVLDGPAVARPSDLAAALQPLRGDARPRLRLAAIRRAADLRLAREHRPAAARGRERPRRE